MLGYILDKVCAWWHIISAYYDIARIAKATNKSYG